MALAGERLYAPYKIAALVESLAEDGVPAEAVLRGTGLDLAALHGTACLSSIGQFLCACSNAVHLCPDPMLSFRAGARLHLSAYGVYGLLLLSSASVRDSLTLAAAYQLLATPTMAMDVIEDGADMLWLLPDEGLDLPPDLHRFLVEQQFALQSTHLRDLLGTRCGPTLACLAYPAPAHAERYAERLGCPCVFGWPRSEIRYPKDILARRPTLANPHAAAMLKSTCDGLIADLEASLGFAGKVYRALRLMHDPGASMKAVASMLKMTDRTLRRRLADEGTSFSTISHHVRYRVATQQLKGSAASIEQIAAIAGFSDPANFRRAFIRWTSMSPAQYRRLQQR